MTWALCRVTKALYKKQDGTPESAPSWNAGLAPPSIYGFVP